ncbi:hypothetical protein QBC36DRAFT_374764 [Triangularia setosa]|uniref:RBR-type E3 ubiquitin transferase n=1 Tax=Triangularia setosa TaxID=2587417 RepID=A0AAN6WF68_9PEZI|nr:hypothetical protein QBC36DRAFT_374764 [Podospora setosa]
MPRAPNRRFFTQPLVPEDLEPKAIEFDKDTIQFLEVVLVAVLQAIVLAVVGHTTRITTLPLPPETALSDEHQPNQQTMTREIAIDEPSKAIAKDKAEHWGDLNPFKPPNPRGKYKVMRPERSDLKGKGNPLVDSAVSIHDKSPQSWSPPPQPEYEGIDFGEHFPADYPAPEEEPAGTQNETPTEKSISEKPMPLPSNSSSSAAISASISVVNPPPLNDAQPEPQRPTVKPSRSWLRRVFSHRDSTPSMSPVGETNSNQSTSASPSALARFMCKTILHSWDGAKKEIECTACFDPLKKGELVKAAVCGHVYCKLCFEQLVLTALESQAQFPPKCCLSPIPCRTIVKYSSRHTGKLYTEKFAEYNANKIYCPVPDCGGWHNKTNISANITLRCSNGHNMCPKCHRVAHKKGQVCSQDHDRLQAEALFKDEGWQKCYKCHVFVEHTCGCRQITCRCGAHFCYVCGAQWRTCHCLETEITRIKAQASKRRYEKQLKEQREASRAEKQRQQRQQQQQQQQPHPSLPPSYHPKP